MNSLLNSENPLDTQTYNRAVELGKHLALQLDAAIRKALNNRMGRTDWVLSEVMPRMQREIFARDGMELWYLDGQPLLEVWSPQTTSVGTRCVFSIQLKTRERELI